MMITGGNVPSHSWVGDPMAQEKSFEEKLKKWLESEGIYALGTPQQDMVAEPCGFWLKRWGGGKYTKSGLPDMQIVVNTVNIEVELKAPNGRPSELQKQKLNQIDDAGCIGFVLYPSDFEKFQKLIKDIKVTKTDMPNIVTFSGLERGCRK